MRLSVVLTKTADVETFVAMIEAADVTVERVPGLPRFLTVHADESTFASFDQTDVISFSPADEAWFQPSRSIEIPRSWRAPWHLLRHTRRDAPWNAPGMQFPLTYDFKCERKGRGVDVYVFDSGLLTSHTEFADLDAWLIYDKRGWPYVFDDEFAMHHGTSVASCAVGRTVGFAPQARLYVSIVFSNEEPVATLDDVIRSFAAAIVNHRGSPNPGVVNMSLGALAIVSRKSDFYAEIIGEALDVGLVIVAAAGNDASHVAHPFDYLPAGSIGVICAAGTARDDRPYVRSNFGLTTDILAAGQHLLVADGTGDDDYTIASGTSFSAPCVTGIVACMLEGYRKPRGPAEVAAVGRYLYEQATFGRYRRDPSQEPQTDGIAYLDPRPFAKVAPIRGLTMRDEPIDESAPREHGYLAVQRDLSILHANRPTPGAIQWPGDSPLFLAAHDVGKPVVVSLAALPGEIESFRWMAGDRILGTSDAVNFVFDEQLNVVHAHLGGRIRFVPDVDDYLRRAQWRATLKNGRQFDFFLCWHVRAIPRAMHHGAPNLMAVVGRPITSDLPGKTSLDGYAPFNGALLRPSSEALRYVAENHCILARLAPATSLVHQRDLEISGVPGAFDSQPDRTVYCAVAEGVLPPGVCVAIPDPVVVLDHNVARGFPWHANVPPYQPIEPENQQYAYTFQSTVFVQRRSPVYVQCLPALIGAPKIAGLYPVTLRWTNDLGQTLDHRVTIEVLEA